MAIFTCFLSNKIVIVHNKGSKLPTQINLQHEKRWLNWRHKTWSIPKVYKVFIIKP